MSLNVEKFTTDHAITDQPLTIYLNYTDEKAVFCSPGEENISINLEKILLNKLSESLTNDEYTEVS